MEKRIHSKKPTNLTYRHYLSHFKWPLLGFFLTISFILFTQSSLTSIVTPYINQEDEQPFEILDTNVLYPTDILKPNNHINLSINDYFTKKDQLKNLDDTDATKKQFKIVLPLNKEQNNQSKSYLILEYTKVFSKPKFCSTTNEEIFGKFCPYTNW